MTKTQKKIFGCFGLGLVTAMTVVAASLPLPIASAITDTIQIRVVDGTPNIDVSASVGQGAITTDPQVTIDATFDSVETINISLDYTDVSGVVHHFDQIYHYSPDGVPGNISETFGSNEGFGRYVYTITATGYGGGAPEERVVEFIYAPFVATAEQNKDDDGKTIDVTVGPLDPDVDKVQIWINGELVDAVDAPGIYKFSPDDLGGSIYDNGTYTVQLVGLHTETDGEGNPILDEHGNAVQTVVYRSPTITVDFVAVPVSPTGVPDTGGLFNNLNVSKEDYLTTGLIIFFVIGVVAFGIVARSRKSNSKSRRRR